MVSSHGRPWRLLLPHHSFANWCVMWRKLLSNRRFPRWIMFLGKHCLNLRVLWKHRRQRVRRQRPRCSPCTSPWHLWKRTGHDSQPSCGFCQPLLRTVPSPKEWGGRWGNTQMVSGKGIILASKPLNRYKKVKYCMLWFEEKWEIMLGSDESDIVWAIERIPDHQTIGPDEAMQWPEQAICGEVSNN